MWPLYDLCIRARATKEFLCKGEEDGFLLHSIDVLRLMELVRRSVVKNAEVRRLGTQDVAGRNSDARCLDIPLSS